MTKTTARNIVLLWAAWVATVIGFQALAVSRVQPQWPDMLAWYPGDPTDHNFYQDGHPYLLEPFMNNQVGKDSEFYLGIAIGGYRDPCVLSTYKYYSIEESVVPCTNTKYSAADWARGKLTPLSYAYFPLYPLMIRLVSFPLRLLALNPIAAATLAGVIVSALGTLAAMLAMYDLTRETLGDAGGWRAVFYMLIFPTAFYFVQVYSEGLFVGLAFGCLALLRRRRWVYVAILAGAAALTRPVGVMLAIPLAIEWFRTYGRAIVVMTAGRLSFRQPSAAAGGHLLLAAVPALVFLLWMISPYGAAFYEVQSDFFGRLSNGLGVWSAVFSKMVRGFLRQPDAYGEIVSVQFSANYFIEFLCLAVGLIAIPWCLKIDRNVAAFSLAAFLVPLFSGPPGIHRYMLAAPALFVSLAHWGRNPVFDRAWTIISLLLMGLLAVLFSYDFWVA